MSKPYKHRVWIDGVGWLWVDDIDREGDISEDDYYQDHKDSEEIDERDFFYRT